MFYLEHVLARAIVVSTSHITLNEAYSRIQGEILLGVIFLEASMVGNRKEEEKESRLYILRKLYGLARAVTQLDECFSFVMQCYVITSESIIMSVFTQIRAWLNNPIRGVDQHNFIHRLPPFSIVFSVFRPFQLKSA